ncbi:helix-turn-helix domain-containing protein [Amycolatopsis mediterranei]|nr:helix-turn-helix transcriptional regulator [Amycolatopsis mediterranei]AEK46753.1 XRE family transcriptional regulator [Amycolatopsis mediterranei S699]KDO07985.1 XRE family transcriptional regulator [Amycolatopsis mediterranei]KDU93119.1 XRE family transcriptional regulator [Amycolatopsis mediterranei]UZF74773.1 helix-turn-helix transcriptional regulator [Amycolatopsis mediterranei]
MSDAAELGAFLKARRAALDPADLGLPPGVTQRRVKGLRREELAQLAGISVDYYTRLEQGRAKNVSEAILGALARALRLDAGEESYLRNLAAPKRREKSAPQRVRPELQHLLDAVQTPAFVFGRYLDVLAWNALGGAVSFDFGRLEERSMPKLVFTDERAKQLHPEWDAVCRDVVANLRAERGKHPDDPHFARLAGELSVASERFRELWAEHAVQEKARGWKLIMNPVVGELRLRYETLRLPDDPDQGLVMYHAEPGSASERALGLLASWIAEAPLTRANFPSL